MNNILIYLSGKSYVSIILELINSKLIRYLLLIFLLLLILQKNSNAQNYFSTDGNVLLENDKLGSTNESDLQIITNNIERLRVTSFGNFGIGTSSPNAKLHVFGDAIIGIGTSLYPTKPSGFGLTLSNIDFGRIVMNDGSANFSLYLNSYYDKVSATHKYVRNSSANRMTMNNGIFRFYVAPFGNAGDNINWNTALSISNEGNIGIGVITPKNSLHILGNQTIDGNFLEIGKNLSGSRNAYIDLIGDDVYKSYGLRIIRSKSDTNANSEIFHRGFGILYLNAQDGGDIRARTNGFDRLTINGTSGNVGIGTNSPSNLLSIRSGIHSANVSTDYLVSISHSLNTNNKYGLIVGTNWASSENFVSNFGNYEAKSGDFTSYLAVKGDGKIGIGTVTPFFNLTINSNKSEAITLQLAEKNSGQDANDGYTISGTNSNMWFHNKEGGGFHFAGGNLDDRENLAVYMSVNPRSLDVRGSDFVLGKGDGRTQGSLKANRAMSHSSNDADNLIINTGGDFEDGVNIQGPKTVIDNKVGIGTGNVPQGYLLAVKGNVLAEEVRVRLFSKGWPDYVFDENYQITSLEETDNYIKKNKHLPGVPSAKEVNENGFGLAEMDALLLKKIEELTLHTIRQQALIEKLEEKINSVKSK